MVEKKMISIICPVYNKELYIRDCIESVLVQTYSDWELILVDDGSPDMCPEILDDYSRKDLRIKVIHQKNSGHSEARNTGIRAAQGEWMMFIDADDFLYDNNVLMDMICYSNEHGLDVCLSKIATLHNDIISESTYDYFHISYDDMMGLDVLCSMIEHNHYHATMCSRLFKSSLIKQNGLFFKQLICDDEEWTPQVLYYATKVGFVNLNGYVIRKLDDSVTGRKDRSTYLRKIRDKALVSVALMEQFDKFVGISRRQKKVLFSKFYSFIHMAYYSYFHDLEAPRDKTIKTYLRSQYKLLRKYRHYINIKCKIQYLISSIRII